MSDAKPDWARLLRIASSLIRQVNADYPIVDTWSIGGGTAMMIQINHRRSDDIDIFLVDPQLLPYLDPGLHDFAFEVMPSDYRGDGSNFLKLAFEGIGEIDFIVSQSMTKTPSTRRTVEGEEVEVETLVEIVTKKVHFRGSHIKPRDIFDIAAAARSERTAIIEALRSYRDDVAVTLAAIDRLNPDFVKATIAALAIEEAFRPVALTALEETRDLLRAV
jgi:hypothetical protein